MHLFVYQFSSSAITLDDDNGDNDSNYDSHNDTFYLSSKSYFVYKIN